MTQDCIYSRQTGLATRQPMRCNAAPATDNIGAHGFQKADMPLDPIATTELACSAGTTTNMKFLPHHRQTLRQYVRIGSARIGHMAVQCAGAIGLRTGAGTTAQSFVILVTLITEGEIIIGALRTGH